MKRKPTLISFQVALLLLIALVGYSEQPVPALNEASLILAQGPHGPHGPRDQQGPPPGRGPASVEQVPRLTKEVVKEMLGKPDVVIVDIRYIKQYEESDRNFPAPFSSNRRISTASQRNTRKRTPRMSSTDA